jgi:hypothetical protein
LSRIQRQRLGVRLDALLRKPATRRREHEAVLRLEKRFLLATKCLIGDDEVVGQRRVISPAVATERRIERLDVISLK